MEAVEIKTVIRFVKFYPASVDGLFMSTSSCSFKSDIT